MGIEKHNGDRFGHLSDKELGVLARESFRDAPNLSDEELGARARALLSSTPEGVRRYVHLALQALSGQDFDAMMGYLKEARRLSNIWEDLTGEDLPSNHR